MAMILGDPSSRGPLFLFIFITKRKVPALLFYGLLDSGADQVLLPSDLALEVGIQDSTQGRSEAIVGVAGQQANVFYFDLELEVVGDERRLQLPVGFSEVIYIPLIGRTFFAYFRSIVFEEQKEEVELKM